MQIEEDMLHYPKEQSRNKDVESFDDSESEDTLTDANFEVLIKTDFLIQLALCIWISAWTVLMVAFWRPSNFYLAIGQKSPSSKVFPPVSVCIPLS